MCSCGDDENEDNGLPPVNPPETIDVLSLELNKDVIVADGKDVAEFTVKLNDKTVTEDVTVYDENGKTYPLAEGFSTTEPGSYKFWAEHKGLRTPMVALKAIGNGPRLTLAISKQIIQSNGEDHTDFIVKYDGDQVTEGVTIYDDKDVALADNKSFRTTEPGEYRFWATYKTEHTETVLVKAINVAIPELPADATPDKVDFSKKVVLTKFTGTTCAFCPKMTVLLNETLEDENVAKKVLLTEAHTFNRSDPGFISAPLAQAFGISSYPTMVVNFEKSFSDYTIGYKKFRELINAEYERPADAGITVSSKLVNNADGKKQLAVHVGVKAAVDGDFRVGAWLLEDGIKAHQHGTEGLVGDFNTLNHVVRVADSKSAPSNYSGIKLGNLNQAEAAEHVFVMDLKDKWVLDKCSLVIFVTKDSERTLPIVNAISCPVEGALPYNYAE